MRAALKREFLIVPVGVVVTSKERAYLILRRKETLELIYENV